jgi:hypothetical protein
LLGWPLFEGLDTYNIWYPDNDEKPWQKASEKLYTKNKYEIKYTNSKFHCRKKAEKAPDTAQKRRFGPPVAKCRKKVYNNKKQT